MPDQLRSAVKGPDRYEPDINATYAEMAQHYGVAIVPARPRQAERQGEGRRRRADRAAMDPGVPAPPHILQLDELNAAIWELLDELNARPFQKLEGCRRSAFEKLDRPALRPLPPSRYELARRKDVGVNIDYHVEYDGATTACRTGASTSASRCGRRRRSSRSSTTASASRRTGAATARGERPSPIQRTDRKTIETRCGHRSE